MAGFFNRLLSSSANNLRRDEEARQLAKIATYETIMGKAPLTDDQGAVNLEDLSGTGLRGTFRDDPERLRLESAQAAITSGLNIQQGLTSFDAALSQRIQLMQQQDQFETGRTTLTLAQRENLDIQEEELKLRTAAANTTVKIQHQRSVLLGEQIDAAKQARLNEPEKRAKIIRDEARAVATFERMSAPMQGDYLDLQEMTRSVNLQQIIAGDPLKLVGLPRGVSRTIFVGDALGEFWIRDLLADSDAPLYQKQFWQEELDYQFKENARMSGANVPEQERKSRQALYITAFDEASDILDKLRRRGNEIQAKNNDFANIVKTGGYRIPELTGVAGLPTGLPEGTIIPDELQGLTFTVSEE